jgi:hypothetical protein
MKQDDCKDKIGERKCFVGEWRIVESNRKNFVDEFFLFLEFQVVNS